MASVQSTVVPPQPGVATRLFYVAVEGEVTEPDYLAYLNREFGGELGAGRHVRLTQAPSSNLPGRVGEPVPSRYLG
jgi:hypothetical protein